MPHVAFPPHAHNPKSMLRWPMSAHASLSCPVLCAEVPPANVPLLLLASHGRLDPGSSEVRASLSPVRPCSPLVTLCAHTEGGGTWMGTSPRSDAARPFGGSAAQIPLNPQGIPLLFLPSPPPSTPSGSLATQDFPLPPSFFILPSCLRRLVSPGPNGSILFLSEGSRITTIVVHETFLAVAALFFFFDFGLTSIEPQRLSAPSIALHSTSTRSSNPSHRCVEVYPRRHIFPFSVPIIPHIRHTASQSLPITSHRASQLLACGLFDEPQFSGTA